MKFTYIIEDIPEDSNIFKEFKAEKVSFEFDDVGIDMEGLCGIMRTHKNNIISGNIYKTHEAKWLIEPRKKLKERDKIVCSNCGGQALYELDEDMNLERALSRCCPHCGYVMSDVDMVNEE